MNIDVAIPTFESVDVVGDSMDALRRSEESDETTLSIGRVINVDKMSGDGTVREMEDRCSRYGWEYVNISDGCPLPKARERAIEEIETEWFLFLDDDVRIGEEYLAVLENAIAPGVGAIQGRKTSRTEPNSDWVRRRARRGATHAVLIRREAVEGVHIPEDVVVLEDEYLRRAVDNRGFLWVFHHQARFSHDPVGRHPIGWDEGWVGGRYGLSAFHTVALNVPFSIATGRNPIPHINRLAGWVAGSMSTRFTRDHDRAPEAVGVGTKT